MPKLALALICVCCLNSAALMGEELLETQIQNWCQAALANDFSKLIEGQDDAVRKRHQQQWLLTQSAIVTDHANQCNAILSLFNHDQAVDHLMQLATPLIDQFDLKPSAERLRQISKIILQQSQNKNIAKDQQQLLVSLSIICHDLGNWIELSELDDHQKLQQNIQVVCEMVKNLKFNNANTLSELSLQEAYDQLNAISQCVKTILSNYNFDADALLASTKLSGEDIDSINRILSIHFKLFGKTHNLKLHLIFENKKWVVNKRVHSIPVLP